MSGLRLFVTALASIVLVACSDDDQVTAPTPGASFRMTVTTGSSTATRTWAHSAGMFNTKEQQSYIYGTDIPLRQTEQELPAFMTIVVPGRRTGTFTVGTTAGSAQMAYSSQANSLTTAYAATSGTVTVTQYGSVGGRIEGTFSGSFASLSGAQVTISNGQFSVQRVADDLYAHDDDEGENPTNDGSMVTMQLGNVSSLPNSVSMTGHGRLQPVETEEGTVNILVFNGQASVNGNTYSVIATVAPNEQYDYAPGTYQWTTEGASAVQLAFTPIEAGEMFVIAANVGQTTITSSSAQSISGTATGSLTIIRGATAEPVPEGSVSFTIKK
jgi:hypothetical protein